MTKIIRHTDGKIYDVLRQDGDHVVIVHPSDGEPHHILKVFTSEIPDYGTEDLNQLFVDTFNKVRGYRDHSMRDFALSDIAEALNETDDRMKVIVRATTWSIATYLGE